MKNLIFISLLLTCSLSGFGKSDSSKKNRDNFYVGISAYTMFPKQKSATIYHESFVEPKAGFDINGTYLFQPVTSFGINGGYVISLFNLGSFSIQLTPEISLNYSEYKYNKFSIYRNAEFLYTNIHYYNATFNFLPTFSYRLGRKSTISLFVGSNWTYSFRIKRNVSIIHSNMIYPNITEKKYNKDISYNKTLWQNGLVVRLAFYRKINKHQYGVYMGIQPNLPLYLGVFSNYPPFYSSYKHIQYGFIYKF